MNLQPSNETKRIADAQVPLDVTSWDAVFTPPANGPFERALAAWIFDQRWYRSKSKPIEHVHVASLWALPEGRSAARIARVEVHVQGERPVGYVLPLAFLEGEEARAFAEKRPRAVVLPIHVPGAREGEPAREGVVVDALTVEAFLNDLFAAFSSNTTLRAGDDQLVFHTSKTRAWEDVHDVTPHVLDREQTNTSVIFGDRFICKVLRRWEEGPSIDLELGRFLTEVGFEHVPALAGYVDGVHFDSIRPPSTVALLHALVPDAEDAWEHFRHALDGWLDGVASRNEPPPPLESSPLFAEPTSSHLATESTPTSLEGASEHALETNLLAIARLGRRVGELHAALASRPADPAFCPEPLEAATRRALSLAARTKFNEALHRLQSLEGDLHARVARHRGEIEQRLERISFLTDAGTKLRVHGDLHLGQVLMTGDDFVFIDFEGEPARPLAERRARRSPVVDVAGMLRSFDYVGWSSLRARAPSFRDGLRPWVEAWYRAASTAFLRGWLGVADAAGILPAHSEARQVLLEFFLLEKCIYEIEYELDHRPDWVEIPTLGLLKMIGLP